MNYGNKEDLINGSISRGIWDKLAPAFARIQESTIEEVVPLLDPNFVQAGFLDPKPPKKKLRLSLSKSASKTMEKPLPSTSQFTDIVSNEQFAEAAKGVALANTKKNNAWVERTFNASVEHRNKVKPDSVPTDLLTCHDPNIICKYMRYFVLKARIQDGNKYPPGRIRSILSGLNRILKDSKAPFSILDKANPSFRESLLTLDTIASDLHREGVGVNKKSALVITFEHEELFRERKVLGYDTPKSLQHAILYSVGLHFVLRGVQEQHNLQLEQLKRFPSDISVYSDEVYYEYLEFISKNNQCSSPSRFLCFKVASRSSRLLPSSAREGTF